jgi:diguanylate cyclase (GGDEF)-like protein/PAS domain S-box-containing protein
LIIQEIYFGNNAQKVALDNAVKKSMERESVFGDFLDQMRSDIGVFHDGIPMKRYLKDKTKLHLLEYMFLNQSKVNSRFKQINFIDHEGNEVLRVFKKTQHSQPYRVSQNQLRSHLDNICFQNSKNKELGKVWFSAIKLQCDEPNNQNLSTPTIRAILPIKHQNSFAGVLVITYFMEEFLKKFTNTPLYDMILYDNQGYTLLHYDTNRSWGNSLPHRYNITQKDYEHTLLSTPLLQTESFVSKKLDLPITGEVHLLLQLKHSYMLEQKHKTQQQYITISAIVFLLSIILSYIIVHIFSATLLNLNRVQKTTKLYENEKNKYKSFLDNASDGIFIMDFKGNLLEYSHKAKELLGYSDEEMQKLSVYDWEVKVPKDQIQGVLDAIKEKSVWAETQHKRKDGSVYTSAISATKIQYNNQDAIYALVRDITEHKEMEQALIESKNELFTIFNTALEGIALANLETKYIKVNRKYCELLGYTEEELLQRSCFDLTDPNEIDRAFGVYEAVLERGYYENFERYCIRKDGTRVRLRSSIALMPNKKQYLITTIDNTKLYNAMKLVKKQSYRDELTGLNNRKSYNKRIAEMMAQFQRYGHVFSLLIFDIDHFKCINDTYGHQYGDEKLQELSHLAQSITRTNDYIFRVGGEEFTILLSNTDIQHATIFAQKLRTTIETEIKITDKKHLTISIGVTQVREEDTSDTLFKRVDDYLYYAKEHGRNQVASDIKKS